MRRAYHRLILPDGTVVQGPAVVVTDSDGHPVEWHPLLAEEAATEWVGGTCSLVREENDKDNV